MGGARETEAQGPGGPPRGPTPPDREDAQRRVDRIRAFREELAELERQGVLALAA